MRIMSLFTGSGMLDRALLEFAPGSELVLLCESDLYPRALLMARAPGVPIDPDVTTLVDRVEPGQADAVVFGSPCQNLSVANVHTRTGLTGEKSGLFWNAVDVVRKVRPSMVLVENVPSGGTEMLSALKETVSWLNWGAVTVPASVVGYPHHRNRVFILGCKGELQPVRHVPGRRNGLLPTPVASDSKGGGGASHPPPVRCSAAAGRAGGGCVDTRRHGVHNSGTRSQDVRGGSQGRGQAQPEVH